MTLATSNRYKLYEPQEVTTRFEIPYPIFDSDDISIYVDGAEVTAFTVSGTFVDGVADDGAVTLTTGVTGVSVEVLGDRDPRRENSYLANSPDLAKNLQRDMDAITAVQQEQNRDFSSALRMSREVEAVAAMTDTAAQRAGRIPIFGSGGITLESGPTADEITAAQGYATAAQAAAVALESVTSKLSQSITTTTENGGAGPYDLDRAPAEPENLAVYHNRLRLFGPDDFGYVTSLTAPSGKALFLNFEVAAGHTLTVQSDVQSNNDPDNRATYDYSTRNGLVAAIALGLTEADGRTVKAAGLEYIFSAGATTITDLPGLLPWGRIAPEHWADNNGTDEMTDAFVAFATYLGAFGGTGYLISPKYVLDGIVLNSLSGISIIGVGPADELVSDNNTWIYWKSGSTADYLLDLRSMSATVFENITFFSNSNASKDYLIQFSCNEDTAVAPLNKFASTRVSFVRCVFAASNSVPMLEGTINLKSAILTQFLECSILGPVSVKMGADTDTDPETGGSTVPDGRVVNTRFISCIFRGDIIRERVITADFFGCYFGKNSVPFSGSNYRVSRMMTSGAEEIRIERLDSCILDSDALTHNVDVWYQSPVSPPAGAIPMVTATNCFFTGANTVFKMESGTAVLEGNTFVSMGISGSEWIGVDLRDGAERVRLQNNNWFGWLDLNGASVQAKAVKDNRTSKVDRINLLDLPLASSFALTSNSVTTVVSQSVPYLEGGFVEVSYSITITAAVNSVFTAHLAIDGVAIPGTYARETTNTTSTKTFTLSLPAREVFLAATDHTTTRNLQLRVQQNSSTPFATIQGESYVTGVTHARIKALTS